jgi:hypothetical protein
MILPEVEVPLSCSQAKWKKTSSKLFVLLTTGRKDMGVLCTLGRP